MRSVKRKVGIGVATLVAGLGVVAGTGIANAAESGHCSVNNRLNNTNAFLETNGSSGICVTGNGSKSMSLTAYSVRTYQGRHASVDYEIRNSASQITRTGIVNVGGNGFARIPSGGIVVNVTIR